MPTRVPPAARPALEPEELLYLFTGAASFVDHAWTPAALTTAWGPIRSSVVQLFARYCPGARPWIWWRIDATAPRVAVVGAHDCPQRDRILREHKGGVLWYGKPGILACGACWDERWESQTAFLRRLQLVLPAEEGVVPLTPQACDAWFTQRHPDGEAFPPTPWPRGEQMAGCKRFLTKGHR